MKSKQKGTPGIEFRITLRERLNGSTWEAIQWIERTATVYFSPGGDHSWSLKKLAFAGYVEGTPLSEMNLRGNTCEVQSKWETYAGKEREKFELALPPRGMSAADGDAELAIDAILSSSSIEQVKTPAPLDANATPPTADEAPSVGSSGGSAPASEPEPSSFDDDDVPF